MIELRKKHSHLIKLYLQILQQPFKMEGSRGIEILT